MKGTLKHIKELAVAINFRESEKHHSFGEVLTLADGREIILWEYRIGAGLVENNMDELILTAHGEAMAQDLNALLGDADAR